MKAEEAVRLAEENPRRKGSRPVVPSPDEAGRLPRAPPNTIAAPGAALGGMSDVFDAEKGEDFSSLSLLQLGNFSLPVFC